MATGKDKLITALEDTLGELSEFERAVMQDAWQVDASTVNQLRFATDFYTVKLFRQTIHELIQHNEEQRRTIILQTNKLIASNETLAAANEKHAASLKWATWALVAVTFFLAIIAGIQVWIQLIQLGG